MIHFISGIARAVNCGGTNKYVWRIVRPWKTGAAESGVKIDTNAAEAVVSAKDGEHRIAHGVGAASHVASNNVFHVAHEVGEHVGATAKAIVDDIKVWKPEMPFEQFGAYLNKVRGVSSTVASVSSDKAHEHHVGPSKVVQEASDLGHVR